MISKGCEQCAMGGKMVLFVYGYCDQRDCFYCPLGENRKNVTDVYANERKVESDADVIEEAKRMDALGSSITGGEPQEALDKTCHYLAAERRVRRGSPHAPLHRNHWRPREHAPPR